MTALVGSILSIAGEALGSGYAAFEVRVRLVDATVQYGDLHALTGGSSLPSVRSTDLLGTTVQQGFDPAVEPDLAYVARKRRTTLAARPAALDDPPQNNEDISA